MAISNRVVNERMILPLLLSHTSTELSTEGEIIYPQNLVRDRVNVYKKKFAKVKNLPSPKLCTSRKFFHVFLYFCNSAAYTDGV